MKLNVTHLGAISMAFVYIVTLLLAIIVWFMPKRLSRQEMYSVWIIVSYIEITVDLTLGVVFDLYYFVEGKSISPQAIFLKTIMAPLFGIIFSNFMPRSFKKFIPYALFWAIFSTFFEWLTIKSGYLTYTGWKLWWSGVFYLFAVLFMRWHLSFIRRT